MATYLIINLIVLAGIVPALIKRRRTPTKTWWLALGALLVLTAVFDNLIIAANIVGYNPAHILGIKLGLVPVEDFFYAVFAMLIVPLLWERSGE